MRRAALLSLLALAGATSSAHAAPSSIANGATGREALDGPWIVRDDPRDRGRSDGYASGGFSGSERTIPYVPNAMAITGDRGIRSHEGSIAWYRTTITVPEDGRYALRFESVNHRADVFLDGERVATHVGTYLPFEAREQLTAGEHTLVVRADWRDPKMLKAEGFHRTWFNFGGINREVSLRRLGADELLAPTLTTRLASDGAAVLDVSVRVRNLGPEPRAIPVSGTLTRGEQSVPFELVREKTIAPGASTTLRTTARVEEPALWAPGSPELYDLALSTPDDASGWRARVGLRELSWRGGAMRINGRRVTLRGASLHEDVRARGDGLSATDQDAIVASLVDLGANATRSQHPLDLGLLERLDAAGILVWQGIGPVDAPGGWTSRTPRLQARARDRVRQTVRQAQLHPSIVAWNLVNEIAGNGHSGGQVGYVRTMARELHGRDPGRMVALDVWGSHPPSVTGPIYADVDAVGVTNYLGWYQDPFADSATLRRGIDAYLARMRRVFAGKVLIVSEFGAEANDRNATSEPGGFANQSRVLGTHVDAYGQTPGLDGFLVWNLRDFAVAPSFAGGSISRVVPAIKLVRGLNQKGIFSWSGRPKPAVAQVRRRLEAQARQARARGGL